MVELSQKEKELIRVYKLLRLAEIEKSKKLEQDITLTERALLYKEIMDIQKELSKIKKQFSETFFKKWLKELDSQNTVD